MYWLSEPLQGGALDLVDTGRSDCCMCCAVFWSYAFSPFDGGEFPSVTQSHCATRGVASPFAETQIIGFSRTISDDVFNPDDLGGSRVESLEWVPGGCRGCFGLYECGRAVVGGRRIRGPELDQWPFVGLQFKGLYGDGADG